MNANETSLLDPFDVSTPDEATELNALTRALELSERFSLIFVRCNQIPQRERLMEEVCTRLPKRNIQTIFFREPLEHLLDAVQARLATPMPDAVFISGLEFSLPVATEAHATPLIANLNASRNSFPQTLPCPVVLWVPEYVLTAIAQGAPDFFSIRSGVYFFVANPAELEGLAQHLSDHEPWESFSLTRGEKRDRITAIQRLLTDYELLPESQRDRRIELRLNEQMGVLFHAQGEYETALKYYVQSLKIAGDLKDCGGEATALHQIGRIYQEQGDYAEALVQYEESLRLMESLGSREGIAISLHQIGRVHHERGDYATALTFYVQAQKLAEELGDRAGVARSLHYIGMIHQERKEYEVALAHFVESLQIKQQVGNLAGVARSLQQIGKVQQSSGHYESARDHYESAYKIFDGLGEAAGAAFSQVQIGQLLIETKRYAEAFELLLNALQVFIRLKSPNARVVMNNLRDLRGKWIGFDGAWVKLTGKEIPVWVLEGEVRKV